VAGVVAAAAALLLAAPAHAEDPLDSVDGTDGWDEIDTSAVDAAAAWGAWRRDLRRWEAGRARLAAERVRQARLRGDADEQPPPPEAPADPESHQARIDAARRAARAGGADRRDESGQVIDDERPWRRR
jgi:hypothetical protein